MHDPIAVIDIGSNSGRIVVLRCDPGGRVEILADGRAPLRLAKDLVGGRGLSPAAIERTLVALRDFRRLAEGSGAVRIRAVATSAIREAENRTELLSRARRDLGIKIEILDGDAEATYAFRGAVQGLPVEHGLAFDLGGGSLEIARFRSRRRLETWTLPLGALRLTAEFLNSDPPNSSELERLSNHVRKTIRRAGLPVLEGVEVLVGTGGTIRNLAKIDRRSREYPIARLHGYQLTDRRVRNISARLAAQKLGARVTVPGLNADRADSIVAGAFCLQAAMRAVNAGDLIVSGQGLREGIAFATIGKRIPKVTEIRRASLRSLAGRFSTWDPEAAQRRTALAGRLQKSLDPGATKELRSALADAAWILDIGRSVDYYNRHRHASMMLAATDLAGFTQREVALLAAVVQLAGEEDLPVESYRPLLRADDEEGVARASVLLRLADELEHRSRNGTPVPLRVEIRGGEVRVRAEALEAWKPRALSDLFRRAFGRELRVVRS